MDDETLYIDTSDFDKAIPDISLERFIKPTGDLILESCSNGEGREDNPHNLANTIARHLPKGVTIHASDKPTALQDISHDLSGKLNVTWNEESLYSVKGER
ncbi:MAG: hypothetical protein A3F82_01090 [Deltaproteobacteria bacterium RIFCSPLOWO2_12_FULL_44_12]|nr:MAG: hypothetical protein A2712_03865 [Deltaproteobacteria bacterium RIFCSPHIGHO2_01_FULL_43_49]OGQ16323.1 MAG: hypothetical protein A3D22_01835 [Deltaproteobacteria bacterium RIFCSPHIGHO2_02_FULL_44_53]OGQ29283.1 MAG: hypothetical protein A3D98_05620 [Deltaproteobacteria bacterium RIFCSPHIGHO2_12_FULL_44_21]OGQ32840.1 MAG: hypothetical protein A2979_09765 [Deltaproteobacteria bacterium RIFCSPLOWO2_01_FULL_45_74]OGQ41941.1 MAG: hypothetical protein A3I70_09550 [Deltaproteobacteria bacterium 